MIVVNNRTPEARIKKKSTDNKQISIKRLPQSEPESQSAKTLTIIQDKDR